MPQLDIVTYISQIFWFIAFFTVFYLLTTSFILPSVAFILKIRQKRLNNIGALSQIFVKERTETIHYYDSLLIKSATTSGNLLGKSKSTSYDWVSITAQDAGQKHLHASFLTTFTALQAKKIALKNFIF